MMRCQLRSVLHLAQIEGLVLLLHERALPPTLGTWKKLTYPFAQGDHEGSPLQGRVVGAGLVPARVRMGELFISESPTVASITLDAVNELLWHSSADTAIEKRDDERINSPDSRAQVGYVRAESPECIWDTSLYGFASYLLDSGLSRLEV